MWDPHCGCQIRCPGNPSEIRSYLTIRYVTLRYVTFHCGALCYVTFRYVSLRYIKINWRGQCQASLFQTNLDVFWDVFVWEPRNIFINKNLVTRFLSNRSSATLQNIVSVMFQNIFFWIFCWIFSWIFSWVFPFPQRAIDSIKMIFCWMVENWR